MFAQTWMFRLATSVLKGVALCVTVIVGSVADAQHYCDSCPYNVDGECLSRPLTFGFYPPQWRRWPAETGLNAGGGAGNSLLRDLPTSEIPDIIDEARIPRPKFNSANDASAVEDDPGSTRSESDKDDRSSDPFRDDPLPQEADDATSQTWQERDPPLTGSWPARIGKGPIASRIRRGPPVVKRLDSGIGGEILRVTLSEAEEISDRGRTTNPLRGPQELFVEDQVAGRTDNSVGQAVSTATAIFEPTLTLISPTNSEISPTNSDPHLRKNPLR